jgi:hypothetical protein
VKRFRATFILLAVFAVLLGGFLVFENRSKKAVVTKEKAGLLVDVEAADIEKISLKNPDGVMTFRKDDKGEWAIVEPLAAGADSTEVSSLADSLASLKFERVVEAEPKDLAAYEIPAREVTFWLKGKTDPVRLLIGLENRIDQTLFAKRADEKRVVLLPSSLKSPLDKKLFDYRQKDPFKFDTAAVATLKVRAKAVVWEAEKKDDAWRLTSPVKALAAKSKVDTVLDALAGLRAKEFVAEAKTPADVKTYGLEKPDYEVALALPSANRNVVFALHKGGEKMFATASDSTKIIQFEGSLLADLERPIDDLRDKKIANFYSWEADRVVVKKGGLTLAVVKEKKGEEEAWRFEDGAKEPADGSKIEAFVRKIESLEAAAFVDGPGDLAGYGLAPAPVEVLVRTKDADGKAKEVAILLGREDAEKKQTFVAAPGLDYLFRVDSTVLQDFPKEKKDWLPEPPKPEEKPDKK